MTPEAIIREAQTDGVKLTLTDTGTIKATGDAAAVNRWLPLIRDHKAKIIEALKAGCGDTATASRWWLLHYLDRDPEEISCSPPATHAEILERRPDAVAAEPFEPTVTPPTAPLTADDEAAILDWLAQIGEDDREVTGAVILQCQRDDEARGYFLRQAMTELPKPDHFPDDRRPCTACRHLRGAVCVIAEPREGEKVVAIRGYRPVEPDKPRRCPGFEASRDAGRT